MAVEKVARDHALRRPIATDGVIDSDGVAQHLALLRRAASEGRAELSLHLVRRPDDDDGWPPESGEQ